MRTKIAVSTMGLLISLTGCGGGGETGTGSASTTGGHGGGAATTTTGAGGASGTTGAGGTGGAMSSTGSVTPPGTAIFGAPCTKNGDCASMLCVDIDATHSVCTKPCVAETACPPAPEWSCASNGGGTDPVCLCQPSGAEICDGQDNDCNGVVDDVDCPELFGTPSGPVADMELGPSVLVLLTDKTIETLPLAGGSPVTTLRSDIMGAPAIAVNGTTIYWIQGQMHQMGFTGLAQPDIALKGAAPYGEIAVNDTSQFYRDPSQVWRSPPYQWANAPGSGPLVVAKTVLFWASGTKIYRSDASALDPNTQAALVTNLVGPVFFATDGSGLFWGDATGAINKALSPQFTVTNMIMGEPGISGIAVDADNIYWSTSDSLTSVLWKIPLLGGAKTKIGGVTGVAHHLIASGNHLYFDNGKLVWRAPIQ